MENEIDLKLKEFQEAYCPSAKIALEFSEVETNKGEASVSFEGWKTGYFLITIYPSYYSRTYEQKNFILQHELTHIQDVVNPQFGFDYGYLCTYGLGESDKTRPLEQVISNFIWDVTIDIRLEKKYLHKVYSFEQRINLDVKSYLKDAWNGVDIDLPLKNIEALLDGDSITLAGIKQLTEKVAVEIKRLSNEKEDPSLRGLR